eukprot:1195516-Prorocentrum_minimum.AAC.2
MRVSGNPSRGQPFLGCPEKQGRRRRHPQGQDPGSAASVYQHAAEHADVDPGGEGGEGGGGGVFRASFPVSRTRFEDFRSLDRFGGVTSQRLNNVYLDPGC